MNKELEQLRKIDEDSIGFAMSIMKADEGRFYSLDFLFLAALNRSRVNIHGFLNLMEKDNYLAAAPFVRMQLDTVLRLFAAQLVNEPQDFAKQILDGFPIRKIKDKMGNKMTDAYLLSIVAEKEPWITKVYESGSGFIHLSNKHIFGLFSDSGDNGKFEVSIGPTQNHIQEEHKIEATLAMIHITKLVLQVCNQWLTEKQTI